MTALVAPRSLSALSLDGIADQVRMVWADTKKSQTAAWEGYLTTGHLLRSARERFPSDKEYGRWFGAQRLEFSTQWAGRLMSLAAREPEVRALLETAVSSNPPGVNAVYADLTGTHVANNSGEMEWYTPREYIRAVVAVMGAIDLDPCSTPEANEIVGATEFFTAEQDAFEYGWHGRVFMNPPYHKDFIWPFCEKLCEELSQGNVAEAIALTNNSTETVAFQRMAEIAGAMCFPKGRISYWAPDRSSKTGLQGQVFIYFGENVERFRSVFLEFGFTVAL